MAVVMAASFQGSGSCLSLAQRQTALLGGDAHGSRPSAYTQLKKRLPLGLDHTPSGPCTTVARRNPGFSDLVTAFRIPGALQCTVKAGFVLDFDGARRDPAGSHPAHLWNGFHSALPCVGSGPERSNALAYRFARP